jgi:hypothetical protein
VFIPRHAEDAEEKHHSATLQGPVEKPHDDASGGAGEVGHADASGDATDDALHKNTQAGSVAHNEPINAIIVPVDARSLAPGNRQL